MPKSSHVILTSHPDRVDQLAQIASRWDARQLGRCAFETSGESAGVLDVTGNGRDRIEAQNAGLDCNLVAANHRRKRLLVADMESTIIEQEMLDELADFVGNRDRISEITERAMRGELDFDSALRERVATLAGLDSAVLDEVSKRITYMPGARELVATMRRHGAYCALVSGGFTVFTERVAKELGFDEHQANTLEIADGKLTGRVVPPILGREAKLQALRTLTDRLKLTFEDTLAVGDGANDVAMLEAAGLGVAFHAKPKVRDHMASLPNGAVITHGDHRALLHLQGYTDAEITAG